MKAFNITMIAISVSAVIAAFIWLQIQRPPKEFSAPKKEFQLTDRFEFSPILGVSVPTTMNYEKSECIDFAVHHFRFLSNKSSIGIYVGNHPRRFIEDAQAPIWKSISGRDVEWVIGEVDDDLVAETILEMFLNPGPEFRGKISINTDQVHIFVKSDNRRDLEHLMEFCESLRLVRPSPPRL